MKLMDAAAAAAGSKVASDGLISALKSRATWPWTREYLKSKDKKPGTGWTSLGQSLKATDSDAADLIQLLTAFYDEVRIAGNKYVQMYHLSEELVDSVVGKLDRATVKNSSFGAQYPYPVSDTELLSCPSELTLCEILRRDDDRFMVFCSRRDYVEKEIFEGAAAEGIAKFVPTLAGYDSFVGLKRKSIQAFDLVVVRPRLRRLELMVDLPLSHLHDLQRSNQALKLVLAASLVLPELHQFSQPMTTMNLYPAIQLMYEKADGGDLQSIRCRTSTGLIDHLKTVVAGDLRVSKYHTDAAKAVNNEIQTFEIITRLKLTMPESAVTIKLGTSSAMLSQPPGTQWLSGLDMTECMTQRDAVRAMNRVVSFLG